MTSLANVSKVTTRASHRWLVVARVSWVLLALLYASSYLITLPGVFSEDPRPGSPDNRVPIEDFRPGLAQFGVTPEGYTRYTQLMNAIVPLIYMVLGIFVFWRKSDDWMGILTSLLLIGFINRFDRLVGQDWAQLALFGNVFTTTLTFLWFFVFPDGRFAPRWMRWLFFLLVATQVWRLFQEDPYTKSFVFLAPVFFGSVVVSQISHYRRAKSDLRRQIKWVVFGTVLGAIPLFLYLLTFVVFQSALPPLGSATIFTLLGDQLWMFFVVVLPIALTFAIFRSRLFDIDVIIRRTIIYSLVTAALALVYFGGVILLQQLFRSLTGAGDDLAIILSTLTIAALFNPLRRRIQDAIDRRFYRRKYDAQQVLAGFAKTARDETDLGKLVQGLANVVDDTMRPESVSVWLKRDASSTRPLQNG